MVVDWWSAVWSRSVRGHTARPFKRARTEPSRNLPARRRPRARTQVDAARSQVARLEHRLASLQQFKDRGYDIDVSLAGDAGATFGGGGGGAGGGADGSAAASAVAPQSTSPNTNTPLRHSGGGGGGVDTAASSPGGGSVGSGVGVGRSRSTSFASDSDHSSSAVSGQEALAKVEYLRNLVLQYMTSADASTKQQMEVCYRVRARVLRACVHVARSVVS